MELAEVGRLAVSHTGVKRKGTAARPAWYVDDRLIVRWCDETSVVIRTAFVPRERLLVEHPGTFSVPPRFETHMLVVVELTGADPVAVAAALDAAVRLQRKR